MTALSMNVRELSFDEIDEIAGGPLPLLAVIALWGLGAAGAAVIGEFTVGFVNGLAEELNN